MATRMELENAILMRLRGSESTRVVATGLHVSQSFVAKIKKKRMSDVAPNRGGRQPLLTSAEKRACFRAITLGGIEVAIEVGQHVHR